MKHYVRSIHLDRHCEKLLIAFNCSLKPDGLCSSQTMGINYSLLDDLLLTAVWTQSCKHDRLIERQSRRRKYTGFKKSFIGFPRRALKKKKIEKPFLLLVLFQTSPSTVVQPERSYSRILLFIVPTSPGKRLGSVFKNFYEQTGQHYHCQSSGLGGGREQKITVEKLHVNRSMLFK